MEATEQKEPIIIKEATNKGAWRPALAWVYVFICLFDFALAPMMITTLHAVQTPVVMQMEFLSDGFTKDEVIEILKTMPPAPELKQWEPLTLQGAGFFHIAMGGILGIGSYTRGREKQLRVENGYITE